MANKFQQGNKAYIVDNARFLREVIILRVTRDFCTIRYIDSRTIIKIRTSRLYANKKEGFFIYNYGTQRLGGYVDILLMNQHTEHHRLFQ